MAGKVLITGRDVNIRTILEFRLEQEGYTVVVSKTGPQALEQACMEQPELIILDLAEPPEHGLDFLGRVRSRLNHASVPIIVLSTFRKDELDSMSVELQDAKFLLKPFSPRELVADVHRIISSKHHSRRIEVKAGLMTLTPHFDEHTQRANSSHRCNGGGDFNRGSFMATRYIEFTKNGNPYRLSMGGTAKLLGIPKSSFRITFRQAEKLGMSDQEAVDYSIKMRQYPKNKHDAHDREHVAGDGYIRNREEERYNQVLMPWYNWFNRGTPLPERVSYGK